MTSSSFNYITGHHELLNVLRSLWEGLNRHHQSISSYFKEEFATYRFEARIHKLNEKYAGDNLRVDIALHDNRPIGYIISGVGKDGIGEIESIYVENGFRGQSIGNELMGRALGWLEERQVHTKIIDVAVGNERAVEFYARYGFYPRVTRLKQRPQK